MPGANVHTATACRFKLNSCTARLTQLGVTWPIAEAAAKATGAEDNAAAELIFSGVLTEVELNLPRLDYSAHRLLVFWLAEHASGVP